MKSDNQTPESIKEFLDKFVIGQNLAKQILSVSIYTHKKRINNPELNLKKSNIILAGPTGSGKTYMISKLAEVLNIPWVTVDCSSLTAAGYIGGNIEDAFSQLLDKANGNLKHAQCGIVYLDEIDKIKSTNTTSSKELDVGGRSVQQGLLKLLEGTKIDLNGYKTKSSNKIKMFDTQNILFIASGTFVGLNHYDSPKTKDFIDFGMIPEFMGRFQLKTSIKRLDLTDMIKILSEVHDNIVQSYKNWFKSEKIELIFEPNALKNIAKMGLKNDTGARGLQSIMDKVLLTTLYNIPSLKKKPNIIKITSKSLINGKHKFIYNKDM